MPTALACLAAIHREDSSSSQREGEVKPLPSIVLSAACHLFQSILTLHTQVRGTLDAMAAQQPSKLGSPTIIMPWFAELNHLDHQSLPDVCSPSFVGPLDSLI